MSRSRNAFNSSTTRPTIPPAWRVIAIGVVVLLPVFTACQPSGSSVTISGDVPGLDTLALKGDSLIANAGRLPNASDTLRAMLDGKITRPRAGGTTPSAATVGASAPAANGAGALGVGVNAMTARARARGDSMARAEALKYMGGAGGAGKTSGDTVRGVVTLVGQDPVKQAALSLPNGTIISLSGMATTGMARLAGTEIMVRGMRISPRDVVVREFFVRAVNGEPAYDGKLEGGAGAGWSILLSDGSGRKRLASVPSALQSRVGTRVWIASHPGTTGAPGYGVIVR